MIHFTIAELCRSIKAEALQIPNIPTEEHKKALTALVDNVLDPARSALGIPVTVNSGYRCRILNEAVDGSKTSQHLKGEAADVIMGAGTKTENKQLFYWIAENTDFDQLIDERNYTWIHVSYSKLKNRKQILHY